MTKISEPIVFFGSGPVAAESLRLLNNNFRIEAVVTKPRAAHHHGDVPVLELAEKLALPIKTVTNKADLDALFGGKPFESKLGILIDFGIIVSQKVIDYFQLGIINSHFSLLPEWRGADPITFSILSGQKTTGVSLMLLSAGMDEGPLLAQTTFDIPSDMTTPELTDALIDGSYQALCHVVPAYLTGAAQPAPQEAVSLAPSKVPTYSRRLTKEDSIIDWSKPAEVIEREIRAFSGWPKSRGQLGKLDVILTKTHVVDASGEPGKAAIIDKQLVVYCGQGALVVDRIKPAGKKEMTGEAFLAGYKQLVI
ncbi:MAG TPA: methionyl-tRNA formyltransferase [Patescibacteria group bacterium]|nr:methionyl-tRNA formyltransferase [Patescibacteria group bacterium]